MILEIEKPDAFSPEFDSSASFFNFSAYFARTCAVIALGGQLLRSFLLCCGQLLSCDGQQVGRHDGRPNIGFEGFPAFPGAPGEPHAAFQPGYPGFNTGTKATQPMIHILAAAHVGFLQSALFGKAHILDLAVLGKLEVVFRCKAFAVETDLERVTAESVNENGTLVLTN